jgi:hypothetical protein
MSSPSLTGPTRPIHTAASNDELDEIACLLASGEPVDPRNEVSLSLSSISHLLYTAVDHVGLSQGSIQCRRSSPREGS